MQCSGRTGSSGYVLGVLAGFFTCENPNGCFGPKRGYAE